MELIGFFFISILGTIMHFVYDWSNHNKYVGLFSAVNESVWEHLKLIVFPSLIWMLIEIPFLYDNGNFLVAKVVSLIFMILFIPFSFYLYKYIFKKNNFIFDILIFYITIGIGQYISSLILNMDMFGLICNYISLILLIIIYGYFLIATFLPGKSVIYTDPNTKKKGFLGHRFFK